MELLQENDPEEPYRRRNDEEKKGISWGQRKLLMMLISFLSEHLDENIKNPTVVYAGAAPGINIEIASSLFPNITWHLYDPAPFGVKTNLSKRFIVYRKKFTDKTARYWEVMQKAYGNIYFISDIRTADYTKTKNLEANEKQIMRDMTLQKNWVEIIKPVKSHLKFRLPYVLPDLPKEIEYFDGIIYKQAWAPQTSTETRIVLTSPDFTYKTYSCEKYQSQMFYHNVITRENNPFTNPYLEEGDTELLDDYDSCCEVFVWSKYLNYIGKEVSRENILTLSESVTKSLTKDRKYSDTLSYLRENPRAIKDRNFLKKSN